MGNATLVDRGRKGNAREGKTCEHADDVIAQPNISRLRWVATHIKEW